MALFWAVMSLVHHWAEWSVWTGTDAGYCRTITWEERCLRLRPPCVVDRLCGYSTKIKVPGFALSLYLIGLGTLSPGGVLVCAELRWGFFPREGFPSW